MVTGKCFPPVGLRERCEETPCSATAGAAPLPSPEHWESEPGRQLLKLALPPAARSSLSPVKLTFVEFSALSFSAVRRRRRQ